MSQKDNYELSTIVDISGPLLLQQVHCDSEIAQTVRRRELEKTERGRKMQV